MDKNWEILVDFVQGTISKEEFEQEFYYNSELQDILNDTSMNWSGTYLVNSTPFLFLTEQNLQSSLGALNAQEAIQMLLDRKGIPYSVSSVYEQCFHLIQKVQPKYVDADWEFIETYILPSNNIFNQKELELYCKDRYKELFRFQSKPPKWIQNPQWPIKDAEPYYFIGQLELKSIKAFHDDGIIYVFINDSSGEIKNVIQTY